MLLNTIIDNTNYYYYELINLIILAPPPAILTVGWYQGRPSPMRPRCIPSLFQISPSIFEKFTDSLKIFPNCTFSRKISRFSSAKISYDIFCHRPQISNFPPIFPLSVRFPPVSLQLLFPPYFQKCPSLF